MDGNHNLHRISFYLLLLAVSVAMCFVLAPFFSTVLWGAILALIFQPAQRWLVVRFGRRRNLAALTTLLLCIVVVILPATLVAGTLIQQIALAYAQIRTGSMDIGMYFSQVVHALPQSDELDVDGFEKQALERIHMPAELVMRHRLPHFQHLFSGGGYAAAYYSYMWSEVLDADAFAAFSETGNAFDPATAQRLRDYIYSAGNLRDPGEAYKAFRGRLPTVEALLKKRGIDQPAAAA